MWLLQARYREETVSTPCTPTTFCIDTLIRKHHIRKKHNRYRHTTSTPNPQRRREHDSSTTLCLCVCNCKHRSLERYHIPTPRDSPPMILPTTYNLDAITDYSVVSVWSAACAPALGTGYRYDLRLVLSELLSHASGYGVDPVWSTASTQRCRRRRYRRHRWTRGYRLGSVWGAARNERHRRYQATYASTACLAGGRKLTWGALSRVD